MKLVSFGAPGAEEPGLLEEDRVVPLRPLLAHHALAGAEMPAVLALLPYLEQMRASSPAPTPLAREDVRLGPPVPRPGTVFAVAANYRAFVAHARSVTPPRSPTQQMIFAKPPASVVGPSDPLVAPADAATLDYELELAVAIGAGGRRIARADAPRHVAGVLVANDVTAPDRIRAEPDEPGGPVNPLNAQLLRGKGYDSFLPTGPWIATLDEVDPLSGLALELRVNGELRQQGSTADMVLDPFELVARVSAFATLRPGDLILTGSPLGTGLLREPPTWLAPGDVIEATIEGLGTMRTPVVAESGADARTP